MPNTIIYDNGYIVATATSPFGTDANADEIEQMLCRQPKAEEGYVYLLRADTLDWELVELPPVPVEEEATLEDALYELKRLGVETNE